MRDPQIESKVNELVDLVDKVNKLMSELQDLKVEVRITYVDQKDTVKQSIKIWRCIEHNDYLTNE